MAPAGKGAREGGPIGEIDAGFVGRTYRSTLILASACLLCLWRYEQGHLVLPALIGVGVGLGLLYGNEIMVRRWLNPERLEKLPTRRNPGAKRVRMRRREIALILVKYLSAIVLLWYIAANWDMLRIAAFVGGVCLVQVSIATRAFSRVLLGSLR